MLKGREVVEGREVVAGEVQKGREVVAGSILNTRKLETSQKPNNVVVTTVRFIKYRCIWVGSGRLERLSDS